MYFNILAKDGSWAQTRDLLRVGARFLGLGLGPLEITLADHPSGLCVVAYDETEVSDATDLFIGWARAA